MTMSIKILLSVAAGGAFGAVGRYLAMGQVSHWMGGHFPWATLAVNLVGSFLLGALLEVMALTWSPSQEVRALLVVGVLGSFTTFSTFSMDVYYLFERGEIGSAGFYVAASVILSLAGFIGGLVVFRHLFA